MAAIPKTVCLSASCLSLVLVLTLPDLPDPAEGRRSRWLPGPVEARVRTVIDGDTVLVAARIWLGQRVVIRVRLAGIDAPELRGRCAAETARGRAARDRLQKLLVSRQVTLRDVRYGKYAGRVIARLFAEDGTEASTVLLKEGLARRYRRGRRRGWCS